MKEKKQPKPKSGSVKVDPSVLQESKEICKKNGLLVTHYATEALKERNKKYKNEI